MFSNVYITMVVLGRIFVLRYNNLKFHNSPKNITSGLVHCEREFKELSRHITKCMRLKNNTTNYVDILQHTHTRD